jgi:hypothetical protein
LAGVVSSIDALVSRQTCLWWSRFAEVVSSQESHTAAEWHPRWLRPRHIAAPVPAQQLCRVGLPIPSPRRVCSQSAQGLTFAPFAKRKHPAFWLVGGGPCSDRSSLTGARWCNRCSHPSLPSVERRASGEHGDGIDPARATLIPRLWLAQILPTKCPPASCARCCSIPRPRVQGAVDSTAQRHTETVSQRRASARLRARSISTLCSASGPGAHLDARGGISVEFSRDRRHVVTVGSSTRFIAFLSNGRSRNFANFAPAQHQPVCSLVLAATMQAKLHTTGLSLTCGAVVRYFWGGKTLHRTTRACTPILAYLPHSAPVIYRISTLPNHRRLSSSHSPPGPG